MKLEVLVALGPELMRSSCSPKPSPCEVRICSQEEVTQGREAMASVPGPDALSLMNSLDWTMTGRIS